ncbi:MAG: hypothetical protein HGA44_12175 [Cellulomonadaceae bacterium]|nr:hypothetical protein [Cellulomonadaceae bacterium]
MARPRDEQYAWLFEVGLRSVGGVGSAERLGNVVEELLRRCAWGGDRQLTGRAATEAAVTVDVDRPVLELEVEAHVVHPLERLVVHAVQDDWSSAPPARGSLARGRHDADHRGGGGRECTA